MTTNTNNIVTIPTEPGFTTSDWTLIRTIGTTVSPFTGEQKTQEFPFTCWTGTLTLPPMLRSQAALWQSFLVECRGTINSFKIGDPDAKVRQGTYAQTHLTSARRVNSASVTLSFAANGTITCTTSIFGSLIVGDFIHVTGATNEVNNGTHKITTTTNATTIIVDKTLTVENTTSGCSCKQNVSGATGLSLNTVSSDTGTIKAGDYLGVLSGNSLDHLPFQLVLVTEDATRSTTKYAVKTQPRLRKDLTDGHFIRINGPQGLFRLVNKDVNWDTDRCSKYGISFQIIEDLAASNT